MTRLGELFARPIAHRGLHDRSHGIIENSPAAVRAAVDAGYACEVDVQITRDGEAVVFHDDSLHRLTSERGLVSAHTRAELTSVRLTDSTDGDHIWCLRDLLDLVGGSIPLLVEMKSRWNGDRRIAIRTAELLASYRGVSGAKSFDPDLVAAFRHAAPEVPRGIIGYAFDDDEARSLSRLRRVALRNVLHWPHTRPDFISWDVRDLERRSLAITQRLTGAPLMTWTVRTPADQARAGLFADQMVFEGFRP